MRVTVFGAGGNIGSQVIAELLDRGHNVVAYVHNPSKFIESFNLKVIQGDIYDVNSVKKAVLNCEAVISTLGSWGTPKKDILTSAMKNIVPAVESANVRRIVTLTGSDARASGDDLSLNHKVSYILFNLIAGKVLKDGENHIKILEASNLNWTVVRAPRINKRGVNYQLSSKRSRPWDTIGRRAVAKSLVDLAENDQYYKQSPYIHRG